MSDYIRERLIERGFPPEKLRVLHYGVPIEASDQLAHPSQALYVLFAGRFVEKKGIDYLIEAMQLLRSRRNSHAARSRR